MSRVPSSVLALLLVVACGATGPNPVTYNAYQLTCCTQTDIDQVWQPGKEVDLHWTVESSTRTTVNPTHKVVIVVTLTGPYADVATLKQAKGGSHVVQGSVITMDDRVPPLVPEVTTFLLPGDLPAGYYKLSFKTDFGDGSSAGSASIVQVGTQ
jgi:hypothetical protein